MINSRCEAPGAGPVILGDPVLLEWALESLVKNAIDALQGRGGTITVRSAAERRSRRRARDGRRPGCRRGRCAAPCSSRA